MKIDNCNLCLNYVDECCFNPSALVKKKDGVYTCLGFESRVDCSNCAYAEGCLDAECANSGFPNWRSSKESNPFNDPQEGGGHYRKNGTMDVAEWCERRGHSPCEMNIIKYVDRHNDKNGIEDLKKAYQYLKFLSWIKYGQNI